MSTWWDSRTSEGSDGRLAKGERRARDRGAARLAAGLRRAAGWDRDLGLGRVFERAAMSELMASTGACTLLPSHEADQRSLKTHATAHPGPYHHRHRD